MGKRSGKTPQKKSELLFFEEAERKPMESVVFFRSGHINLTTLRPAITRSIKTVAVITRPIQKRRSGHLLSKSTSIFIDPVTFLVFLISSFIYEVNFRKIYSRQKYMRDK